MDGQRFDRITRALASGASRRQIVKGLAGGVAAGFAAAVGRRAPAGAQVTQAQCGNKTCKNNPGTCNDGCVCCVFGNGNSRCMPPGNCNGTPTCPEGEIFDPIGGCVPDDFPFDICFSDGDCDEGFFCVFEDGIPFGICSPEETTFNASPELVWHALTDAGTLTSLGIPSDIAPRKGHLFQFRSAPGADENGVIVAEMISVDAPHQFAFKWLNGPLNEPTTVTVNLDPIADGTWTRVRLSHTDPTGKSCRAGALVLGRNWGQRLIKDALPTYLSQNQLH